MAYRSYLFFLLVFGLTGCGEFPPKDSIDKLLFEDMMALGHGGMGTRALLPLNSKASIDECFSLSPDGTEVDVQMTNDGVVVCFHDEKLDRSTTCFGRIADMTWEELSSNCEYAVF